MEWFGASNKTFDFDLFSQSHLVILTIFILIVIVIFLNRRILSDEKWRRTEIGVAISLILFEITNHVWMYVNGIWKIGRSMPLELCNIGLILSVILLLTRKILVFELLFFIALLGATQAIITPFINIRLSSFSIFPLFLCTHDGCVGNLIFYMGKRISPHISISYKTYLFY